MMIGSREIEGVSIAICGGVVSWMNQGIYRARNPLLKTAQVGTSQ
jgi:hypothetical protein